LEKDDVNNDAYKLKRHYFGKFLLETLGKQFRVINFDESAIVQMNYALKSWSPIGKSNLGLSKPVAPRVTLVAAVDNLGNKYLSCLQCNSDRFSTQLLLSQLFELLDEEDPYWKESSIILLDGVGHHSTDEVKALFRIHRVSYCITSPNSP
jgi:hypothetical protein